MRLYNPEVFQGSLRRKNYFEGWYFKQVTGDLSDTVAIIPGISTVKNDPHSFIQVMNGSTGFTDYIRYPLEDFRWKINNFFVKIGSSTFSRSGITLNIKSDNTSLSGKINFRNVINYPKRIFSPGIMGWYSFVPFMECNHGIVSANHGLTGRISLNKSILIFDGGKGYIEKDWGVSFPEAWIWVQSNNFNDHDTSFMVSIAKIPWLGRFFIGLISFLYLNKKFYLFSTYNRSVFSDISNNKDTLHVTLKNDMHKLKITVIKNSFCDLKAPASGEMSRRIKESIDSELKLQMFDRQDILVYEGTGKNVGLEIIEKIFHYI
jgi:hypothetical protein